MCSARCNLMQCGRVQVSRRKKSGEGGSCNAAVQLKEPHNATIEQEQAHTATSWNMSSTNDSGGAAYHHAGSMGLDDLSPGERFCCVEGRDHGHHAQEWCCSDLPSLFVHHLQCRSYPDRSENNASAILNFRTPVRTRMHVCLQ